MARRRDIERLSEEIEELFSDLWQVPRFSGQRRAFRRFTRPTLSTASNQT